ncbi:hypothetical protein SS50377_24232 [Spironucleus salmonicida]|uniref:Transglutaminase-like domain-containing protein n=1 Tax=Spironucleus salmonicida TaxID=348837 RepID=A0A9P8RZ44_9EUKA|nr:hypothetical protein SS50377_24232 [Spironucleus salmonicida]
MKHIRIFLRKPKRLVPFTPKYNGTIPSSEKLQQQSTILTRSTPKTPVIKKPVEVPTPAPAKTYPYKHTYFFTQASLCQRSLINSLVTSMASLDPTVTVSPLMRTKLSDYQYAQFFIKFQVPELYFADLGPYLEGKFITKIHIVYRANAIGLHKELIHNCNYFIARNRLTASSLPEAYLHFTQTAVIFGGNVADQTASQYSPNGPFLGVAVCAGITKLFCLLGRMLGLNVIGTVGNTKSGEFHAWNLLQLGKGWYHADFTWCLTDSFPRYFQISDTELGHVSLHILPKCINKEKSYLATHKMVSERPDEVVKCFERQYLNGRVCIQNTQLANKDVIKIIEDGLEIFNRRLRRKYQLGNKDLRVVGQTSLDVFTDGNYVCLQSAGRVNPQKIHLIYILGDKSGIVSISEKLVIKQLLGGKHEFRVELNCLNAQRAETQFWFCGKCSQSHHTRLSVIFS